MYSHKYIFDHTKPFIDSNYASKTLCDSLILVVYNHMGAGYYDPVIPKPQLQEIQKKAIKEVHCRCGVNGKIITVVTVDV